MKPTSVAFCIFVALSSTTLGCSSSSGDTAATSARLDTIGTLAVNMTDGKTVYEANCILCHGADGASGTERRNVKSDAAENPTGADRQVLNGGDGMPSFSSLSDQQIADVVAYLVSL